MPRIGWLRMLATTVAAAAAGIWTMATQSGSAPATELKAGDPAPPFELEGSDGRTYRLADFAGREAVVLAWFPKAFTGG